MSLKIFATSIAFLPSSEGFLHFGQQFSLIREDLPVYGKIAIVAEVNRILAVFGYGLLLV